ncbi:hypothetical protein FHT76_006610 [Rhizobium sp. BK176]|nr:hypothetical protein [Rhizobium sp. BK181]MBB3543055.1 hypothetical protein [Rhizobium sp. BK399]MCS3742271.1 hypothetical protein [Rhizobium sp. BK661]MCS4094901.1 hypothetical protein [Rhizobium sp. BK176]
MQALPAAKRAGHRIHEGRLAKLLLPVRKRHGWLLAPWAPVR